MSANPLPESLPRIVFTRDWSQVVLGELRAGGRFAVVYDSARLPEVRDTYHGLPAWSIMVFAHFPEAAGLTVSKALSGEEREGFLTQEFEIPEDADSVVLWFVNGGRSGIVRYDSCFGRNYHFRLPGKDVKLLSASFVAPNDDQESYGGLSVAVSATTSISRVAIDYSVAENAGPYPSRGCISLESTDQRENRTIWSISEFMVPSRAGVRFSILYELCGQRMLDDNGGAGYQAVPV